MQIVKLVVASSVVYGTSGLRCTTFGRILDHIGPTEVDGRMEFNLRRILWNNFSYGPTCVTRKISDGTLMFQGMVPS